MEQQFDLDMPKKCQVAEENLRNGIKEALGAIEVLTEEAKYTGSAKTINAVKALETHVQEVLVASYNETAEFYGKTAQELGRLLAALN